MRKTDDSAGRDGGVLSATIMSVTIWNRTGWQPGTDGHPYLGVAQLAARVIWVHQAGGSNPLTQTIKEEEKNERNPGVLE